MCTTLCLMCEMKDNGLLSVGGLCWTFLTLLTYFLVVRGLLIIKNLSTKSKSVARYSSQESKFRFFSFFFFFFLRLIQSHHFPFPFLPLIHLICSLHTLTLIQMHGLIFFNCCYIHMYACVLVPKYVNTACVVYIMLFLCLQLFEIQTDESSHTFLMYWVH